MDIHRGYLSRGIVARALNRARVIYRRSNEASHYLTYIAREHARQTARKSEREELEL